MSSHGRKYGEKASHVIPVWNGILEHREKIGSAIWEFLWCVDRITIEKDGIGWCLGRSEITVSRIAADLGEYETTARDNLARLEKGCYIVRIRAPHGYQIGVRNSQKFGVWRKSDIRKTPDHSKDGYQKNTQSPGGVIGHFPSSDIRKTPDVKLLLSKKHSREETQQEDKSAEAAKPAAPPVAFRSPLLIVSEAQDAKLADVFTWVDRPQEYKKMDLWLSANRPGRKVRNTLAFCQNWFNKIPCPATSQRGGKNGKPTGADFAIDQARKLGLYEKIN
jgi:hypothetical protein